MSNLTSEADAQFYRLVHRLAGPLLTTHQQERRGQLRRKYCALQRIAPWNGNGFPEARQFEEVICHDISKSGFSFLYHRKPEFDTLVAEFGMENSYIYLLAEVVRCQLVLRYPSGLVEYTDRAEIESLKRHPDVPSAEPAVLVGCRFVDRLQPPRFWQRTV